MFSFALDRLHYNDNRKQNIHIRQLRYTRPALHDGEELQDQVTKHFPLRDPNFSLVSNGLKVFRLKFFHARYLLWMIPSIC